MAYIKGQSYNVWHTGGFGSTSKNAFYQTVISTGHPIIEVIINKNFTGLIDTEADVSIIASEHWPVKWPKIQVLVVFSGVGTLEQVYQSKNELQRDVELQHIRHCVVLIVLKNAET